MQGKNCTGKVILYVYVQLARNIQKSTYWHIYGGKISILMLLIITKVNNNNNNNKYVTVPDFTGAHK